MPTPTGRAARKRYCGVDCRNAAWRQRQRDDIDDVVPAVPVGVPGVPAVLTAFPDDIPTPGGRHRCPHCRQPLAIISVVIPADAAIINPPEVLPPTLQTANLNPPPEEDDLATLGNFSERQHPAQMGGLRDPSNTNADLRAAFAFAGEQGLTGHSLRQTVASLMSDAGLSPRQAADQLGHSEVATTLNRYMGRRKRATGAAEVLERLG